MSNLAHDLRNASPFDLAQQDISDLLEEAKHWLDGNPVTSQDEADAVAKLLDLARKAKRVADDARKEEKRPLDEKAKAIQVKYSPIIKDADLIASTCKAALAPFIEEQERVAREAERVAREQAEAAEIAAQKAMRESNVADIELRQEAEKLAEAAKTAEATALKTAKQRGSAKGGARAVSMRTTYNAVIVDLNEAVKHYWKIQRLEFETLVIKLAAKDVRAGKKSIPGFKIVEHKEVV